MATQRRIAELAGVSRSTVERVINNRGDVSSATRDKVLEIARLLDYHPNRAGQTLAIKQKKLTIGCMIIESDNPFYTELGRGIEDKAEEYQTYGITVLIRKTPFTEEDQIREIDSLLNDNINALVIQPVSSSLITEKIRELEADGIPVVTMNTDIPDHYSQFCYVGNDFHLCGKTAANIMALVTGESCGIGIVTGFSDAKSHYDRVDGFMDYIRDCPGMRVITVMENRDDDLESYQVTKTMLEENPDIDALFLVAGGVQGAGRAIREYPERKVSVISFDDLPETRRLVKDGVILATICQQPVRQGRMALSVLFDYFVEGKRPVTDHLYTDILIKVRANIDQ